MKTIKEDKLVVGMLHTRLGDYELLDVLPQRKGIRFPLQDVGAVAFYVRDGYGVAKIIFVHGEFIIVPASEPKLQSTTFLLDEEVEAHPELVESSQSIHA